MTLTPEYIYAGLAFAATLGVTWEGSWAFAGRVFRGAKAKIPTFTTKPASDFDEIVASVRKSQIEALNKPVEIRTAVLAECDAYLATIRALYSEMAK
jgi:hypothetical protein